MEKKAVIITGGDSQIGREIVSVFLQNNWRVYATIRSKRKCKDPINHENLFYHEMDLEYPRSVEKTIAKIIKKEGTIEALINNAGFVLAGSFESFTQKQVRREMDVNFFGALHTIKAVLPAMKLQKNGCIINISSLCGLVSFPMFSLYHASKWALEGFTESMKYELDPLGIQIKLVEPGGVKDDRNGATVEFGEKVGREYEEVFNAVHRNTDWFPGFSTSKHVAGIVYKAATDKQNTLRYIIGDESALFLNERFEGFKDESFIEKMKNRIYRTTDD